MAIEKIVAFTVPGLTPPSVNHFKVPCAFTYTDKAGRRRSRKGMKLTPEAKAYKWAVAIYARGRTVAPETQKERDKVRYRVEMTVVLGPNVRLDSDNGAKVAFDGLEAAGVIHSDAFIGQQIVNVVKNDRANPRTEFVIERIEEQCPA
jgi:Holliday junction resolvase RusA-like endonuclease